MRDRFIINWYQTPNVLSKLLVPFALAFALIVKLRRLFYQWGLKKTVHFNIPVIVVGNITVGGSGKTPLVAYLSSYLKSRGFKPGIVLRGYKARAKTWPQVVTADSKPELVGDEAVLLAQQAGVPVVAAPRRVVAAQHLIQVFNCDVILSDDGLQHYALGRAIEIAVLDGKRRLGNGYCLPAGPLRESAHRLSEVDFVVVNGGEALANEYQMQLACTKIYRLNEAQLQWPLPLTKPTKVHAVAGIGFPDRFFDSLRLLGFEVLPHAYPDHHAFIASDIDFKDYPIIMTAKDAVKCLAFADARHWCLEVGAELDQKLLESLEAMLKPRANT